MIFGLGTGLALSKENRLQQDWRIQAKLRFSDNISTQKVSADEDAIGAVDGKIDGTWGFHTANEPNPWWRLDFGQPVSLGTVRLFNRCDACGDRNRFLIASVSDDGQTWTRFWQNDGTMFYGATDSKPLVVDLSNRKVQGRFLKLSLEGTSYFHLDEVEVYPPGVEIQPDTNLALGKSATQSSTSQWSVRHTVGETSTEIPERAVLQTLESGKKLAENLKHKGIDVSEAETVFRKIESKPSQDIENDYFTLRLAIRKLIFKNPLLNFDKIVFAKHAPASFPHMSDQYYCWWQRGGGAICLLKNFRTENGLAEPECVNLTEAWPDGTFFRPDLSFDGTKILFSYVKYDPKLADVGDKTNKDSLREDSFFHLYEMDLATGQTRQLTFGKYDDFDGRYSPTGEIVFLSTRKGKELQTGVFDAEQVAFADLPDSYVRCGGDNFRPVPVFTLHSLDTDGKTIRQISAFENFEWTPTMMNDGRIAYTRWDYIDRFNGHFFSLWSTNPDGTKAQLLYGNYTVRPQVAIEPRAIPDSTKMIFVASAHHSNFGGSLVLLDRSKGTEYDAPIERITPEVVYPETEGWPEHFYANPWPLSEDYHLVSWSNKKLPPHCRVSNEEENPSNSMGLYYYDRFGNLELLYRDENISSMNPIPLQARAVPPVLPSEVVWDGPQEGDFLVQDVYEGLRQYGFTREKQSVKRIRIVATVPKVQPHINTPVLGVSVEDTGKFVLGTVPVEEDGSAYFRVPTGVPYFFQALDENGVTIQTMRSLAYLMPGEKATCIGCHENRELTPPTLRIPTAALREPSRITPDPPGTWPLKYSELIQPVLNDRCVQCHSPQSGNPLASSLDLTPQHSYQNLLSFGNNDLRNQAYERDRSIPGEATAVRSKLLGIIREREPAIEAHRGLNLTEPEKYRFAVWMDTYAQIIGSFSEEQDEELIQFRAKIRDLLEE
ncbi:MAG: discoidin domain-containing protein [Planctomycetaceae bacterium]|nr:discoidin domain-containing protein [Planctomycetaceae bacterium]